MDLKIVEERPNPLLKRTEYTFEVGHGETATPNRDSVRGELAKALKVPKDRIVIERLLPKFGTPKTVGEAHAYQTKEAALSTARGHILIRNGLKEKAVKAVPGAAVEAPTAPPTPAPAAPAEPPKGA